VTQQPLTPVEVEHAVDALARLRRIKREPWERDRLNRLFGRASRPLRSTLTELASAGLLELDEQGRWTTTEAGARILTAREGGEWEPLARLLLGRGEMEEEALAVLREAEEAADLVRIARVRARAVAPRLAAFASWVPGWRDGERLVLPKPLLEQATTRGAMEIAGGRPDWVRKREEVGHRAEAYSLRLEREARGPAAILHVSRDRGDGYGYDLEDVSRQPTRLIECKGSRSKGVSFILSANELAAAKAEPERFELHYWGGIELNRDPEQEYELLRQQGYPLVIEDLAGALARNELEAECAAWRVSAARGA
jgi:Domain of unknown function (DUF3883)